jgi:hypothetical protein
MPAIPAPINSEPPTRRNRGSDDRETIQSANADEAIAIASEANVIAGS